MNIKPIHGIFAAVAAVGVWLYFDENTEKAAAPDSASKAPKKAPVTENKKEVKKDLTAKGEKSNTGSTETSKNRANNQEESKPDDTEQDS